MVDYLVNYGVDVDIQDVSHVYILYHHGGYARACYTYAYSMDR